MTLNDVLTVTDPNIEVDLYIHDHIHFMGTIKPSYALKYLASDFRSHDCKLSVIVSTREEK